MSPRADNPVFEAVWQVVTRRTYDRAAAAADLGDAMLHQNGDLRREGDDLFAGTVDLARDRDLLSGLSRATGLGVCVYLGNKRVAAATVLDAGTAPDIGGFAPATLVDACLRRREVYRGAVDYAGRDYIVVAKPLFTSMSAREFTPLGIIEVFQDQSAYFDLLSAASRSGLDAELATVEERADAIASLTRFIDDLARRLQLLALNGNIIAAQAGEHGRAFRVVCRELGALADQAKQTGGDVRRLLRQLGLDEDASRELLESQHGTHRT
jgi:hypothetical protein